MTRIPIALSKQKSCFTTIVSDTIQVSEEEYKELKRQYIAKFGGWEKIDLEHTEYNGKKWY